MSSYVIISLFRIIVLFVRDDTTAEIDVDSSSILYKAMHLANTSFLLYSDFIG